MADSVTTPPRSASAEPPHAREPAPAWSSGTVALVATPHTARAAIPFLSVLGLGRTVVSWQRVRGGSKTPDAFVATRVELVPGLTGAPVAVFVSDRQMLRAAARHDVEVALTSNQRLLDHGAVLVPRAGVDVARWKPRSPEERAAARAELDLPEDLAVAVDHPRITDDVIAALTLAAAAVVTGPMLPLALALGVPVVTSPVSADRLGLHPGLEVEVVSGARRAEIAARALGRDQLRAAELSRRGRRFAEHHLDLGHPSALVAERLGLPPVVGLPEPDPADVPTVALPLVDADHPPIPAEDVDRGAVLDLNQHLGGDAERAVGQGDLDFSFAWPEEAGPRTTERVASEPSSVVGQTGGAGSGPEPLGDPEPVASPPVLRPVTIDLTLRRAGAAP